MNIYTKMYIDAYSNKASEQKTAAPKITTFLKSLFGPGTRAVATEYFGPKVLDYFGVDPEKSQEITHAAAAASLHGGFKPVARLATAGTALAAQEGYHKYYNDNHNKKEPEAPPPPTPPTPIPASPNPPVPAGQSVEELQRQIEEMKKLKINPRQ